MFGGWLALFGVEDFFAGAESFASFGGSTTLSLSDLSSFVAAPGCLKYFSKPFGGFSQNNCHWLRIDWTADGLQFRCSETKSCLS